jgi:hypothetical protein
MYSPSDRHRIRETLIDIARADKRIIGAALTGSAASDREDRWSDTECARYESVSRSTAPKYNEVWILDTPVIRRSNVP